MIFERIESKLERKQGDNRKLVHLGEIRGAALHITEDIEPPRGLVYHMLGDKLVLVSSYQERHGIPQNHAIRNGIGRV